jgi:hypothetical protein
MSREEEFVRLFEDPEVSAELRADLSTARAFDAPFDVGAGLARFQAYLDAPPSGVTHAPPAATGGAAAPISATLQLSGGKILAVLALGAGLGFGALQFAGGAGSPRVAAPAQDTVPAVQAPQPAAGNPAPDSAHSTPAAPEITLQPKSSVHAAPLPARRVAGKRSAGAPLAVAPLAPPAEADVVSAGIAPAETSVPSSVAESPRDRLRQEVAELGEIRRTVESDPAAALALAERGHREFRGGALYQEREALALQALSRLGRTAAVESRGTAFLEKFPQSSFAPEVRRMLGK